MKNIIANLIEKRNSKKFNKALLNVLDTSPIKSVDEAKVLLVSLVHHDALKMSLIAIKSFIKKFGDCKIELINDGSLTEEDLLLLKSHIQNVTLVEISEIENFDCPKGGCWERLCYLLKRTKDHYVIQLDSDTVTIGALPEVHQRVEENKAFTIGGPMFPKPVSLDYMSNLAKNWNDTHVQAQAEKHLNELSKLRLTHYLRGCAAFAGFPKGSNLLTLLSEVSKTMELALGNETWNEWGTEQFSSNVMLSFCEGSEILQWPKYHNHGFPHYASSKAELSNYLGQVSLIHFIGSKRFSNDLYEESVKYLVQILK